MNSIITININRRCHSTYNIVWMWVFPTKNRLYFNDFFFANLTLLNNAQLPLSLLLVEVYTSDVPNSHLQKYRAVRYLRHVVLLLGYL